MSRGLIGFLVFLTVVLLGLGAVAYLLGPNVLAFVFHPERRTEPVVIINLLNFADAQHAEAYRQGFEQPAAALISELGGREIWEASADHVVHGQVLDGWSSMQLVGYPSRSAFIELVTSSDHRALLDARDAALDRSALLSATPAFEFDLQGTAAQVIRFLAAAKDESIATYDSIWLSQDQQLLERHRGELIWRARLNPLVAEPEQQFDEVLIYGFANVSLRDGWVADTERETLQTLQRRLFRRDVLVLSESRPDAAVLPAPPQPDHQEAPNTVGDSVDDASTNEP